MLIWVTSIDFKDGREYDDEVYLGHYKEKEIKINTENICTMKRISHSLELYDHSVKTVQKNLLWIKLDKKVSEYKKRSIPLFYEKITMSDGGTYRFLAGSERVV
jgi:hypothetical protein